METLQNFFNNTLPSQTLLSGRHAKYYFLLFLMCIISDNFFEKIFNVISFEFS